MNTIFKDAFEKGFTYTQYRNLASRLVAEGKVTGHEQSEVLHHYAELNEARMNRLDKTTVIASDVVDFLKNYPKKMIWLVLAENWCGDAAQIVPVVNKMAETSSQIALRILLRDDNLDLMDLFLTNGTRSIPKLIMVDAETFELINDFGPRPQGAKQLILDYKNEHGIIDDTAKTELQKWYFHNKGVGIQEDIVALLKP